MSKYITQHQARREEEEVENCRRGNFFLRLRVWFVVRSAPSHRVAAVMLGLVLVAAMAVAASATSWPQPPQLAGVDRPGLDFPNMPVRLSSYALDLHVHSVRTGDSSRQQRHAVPGDVRDDCWMSCVGFRHSQLRRRGPRHAPVLAQGRSPWHHRQSVPHIVLRQHRLPSDLPVGPAGAGGPHEHPA